MNIGLVTIGITRMYINIGIRVGLGYVIRAWHRIFARVGGACPLHEGEKAGRAVVGGQSSRRNTWSVGGEWLERMDER
jgi:hypothetical protein